MKKKTLTCYLPLLLVVLFALLAPNAIWFSGFFAIAILLSGLKNFEIKKVLLILSPIASYPLILFIFLMMGVVSWTYVLSPVMVIVYNLFFAILYFFLLRNVWDWLDPEKRLFTAVSLVILAAILLIYVPLVQECDFFYYEGGKGYADLAEKCDSAGLLVTSYEHAKFKMDGFNTAITVYNVVFSIGAVLLGMLLKAIKKP